MPRSSMTPFSYYNDIQGVISLVNRQSGQAVERLTIQLPKIEHNEWLIIAGPDAEDRSMY